MNTQLLDLINISKQATGSAISGIDFVNFYGSVSKFTVTPDSLERLFVDYCELVDQELEIIESGDEIGIIPLTLGEYITGDFLTLIVPICLVFQLRTDEIGDLYDDELIISLVKTYQDVMIELLEISPTLEELYCCVLENEIIDKDPKDPEISKMRLILHFPYCKINTTFQRKVLRKRVEMLLRQRNVFNYFKTQPLGGWEDIIKEYTEFVPMYCSTDSRDENPAVLKHIYKYLTQSCIDQANAGVRVDQEISTKEAFRSIENAQFLRNCLISGELIRPLDQKVEINYWLPIFLSINYWSKITRNKPAYDPSPVEEVYEEQEDENPQIRILHKLLPLLSLERFRHGMYFQEIAHIMHNLYEGEVKGLKLLIKYAKKAEIKDEKCEEMWNDFANSTTNLTIKTIGFYAKEDNPDGYISWHKAWFIDACNNAIEKINHSDTAEAVYRLFWLDYFCASKSVWYGFNGINLYKTTAISLEQKIDNYFVRELTKLSIEKQQKSLNEKGTAKKSLDAEKEQIDGLVQKIKSAGFLSSVVGKFCVNKFHVENFESLVNTHPDKLAWKNCITEVYNNELFIRKGKPEDFITMNTGCVLDMKKFSWSHPMVSEVMEWISKVFVDEELREYFFKDCASYLRGYNLEKLFRVHSGGGDNSKSMIMKALQKVFGQYCVDFPVELLTEKKKSASGPTPELAQSKGTHLGIISEPESDAALNTGAIKRYTGNDRFFARFLQENGGSIEAFFKLIYMCNNIPDIPHIDKALLNRFMIIPYLSIWVDDAPEDIHEQKRLRTFKKDPDFEKRVKELAPAFAWIIVQHFPKYIREGLIQPRIVREYTQRHWEENDLYMIFIQERLIKVSEGEVDQGLSSSDVYAQFKVWFRDYFPNTGVPKLTSFKTEMIIDKRLGPQNKSKRWMGYKLVSVVVS